MATAVTRLKQLEKKRKEIVNNSLIFNDGGSEVIDTIEWNEENETLFFQAFINKQNAYKPTGNILQHVLHGNLL